MSADWPEYSLAELYEIRSGLSKAAEYFGSGYPFVSFKDVFGNYFLPDELSQLVQSSDKEREGCSVNRGDVFLTRTSETMHELGMSSVALKDYPGATFNGFTKRLRLKEGAPEVIPEYIGYSLRSPSFRSSMMAFSTMSTRASLNNDMIGLLKVKLPPVSVQTAIGNVLKALDDKITLNTQTNQTLEQMAQALFKSWFVDFDPVIDNALDSGFFEREFAGEDIPEPLAQRVAIRQALREATAADTDASAIGRLPPETRALFPDRFEKHPELGWIPKGWMVKSLAEQTKLIGGGTPKRSNEEFWGGGIPWFSVKDAPNNSDVFVLDTDEKITVAGLNGSSTRLLPVGTTIISARGTVGKLALVGREMAMNQSCYGVLPADGLGLGVYFNYFSLKRIVYWLRQNTHGAVFDTITKQTFETVSSVVPPSTIASEFERQVTPWLDLVKSKLLENVSLSQLRDTLLPKLLSGELTVLDVCQENQVESKVA